MDNDETRRTRLAPMHRHTSGAPEEDFSRALRTHQDAADALGAAIVVCDPRAIEDAAHDAYAHLLAAVSAFRRFERAGGERANPSRAQTASFVLQAKRRALADLFERARSQLTVPTVHQVLDDLGASLALAIPERGDRRAESGR